MIKIKWRITSLTTKFLEVFIYSFFPSFFRFPFYYEIKLIFLIWLISPVSRGSLGSSLLYRKLVHPNLMKREEVSQVNACLAFCAISTKSSSIPFLFQEIDHMITRLQEQGYNTAIRLGSRAFQYVTNAVMQTAIKVNSFICDHKDWIGFKLLSCLTLWPLLPPKLGTSHHTPSSNT